MEYNFYVIFSNHDNPLHQPPSTINWYTTTSWTYTYLLDIIVITGNLPGTLALALERVVSMHTLFFMPGIQGKSFTKSSLRNVLQCAKVKS